jgi:hypothetical protein
LGRVFGQREEHKCRQKRQSRLTSLSETITSFKERTT